MSIAPSHQHMALRRSAMFGGEEAINILLLRNEDKHCAPTEQDRKSHGYLHTTTVFPAGLARAARQEPLPEVQARHCADRLAGRAAARRRRDRGLVLDR